MGPALAVPIMMFAGFGVRLQDLPSYLHWGSYLSFLRYGLEGIVGAIYGLKRGKLECPEEAVYCMHAVPSRFLQEVGLQGDQFWKDVGCLVLIMFIFKIFSYVLLRMKMELIR